jgi:beta-phosphoglucomutase-like phosphatase (HAD superfamily)
VVPWTAPAGTAALVFDCDGTLADTMPTHYRAWVAMLADHGLVFPEPQFYALGGMPTEGIIRLLALEQGVEVHDVTAMSHDKERRYLAMIDHVKAHPSVLDIAARYRGVLPLGVGSGGERWIIDRTLNAIGAADWFDAIVGADDTERHKPEPDVFLEVARRLSVPPASCVVFEDTDLGLEAARRAGMVGVDVRPLIAAELGHSPATAAPLP